MKDNLEFVLKEILAHEGGYVDHPKDPGGATNKGITLATFRRYIKRNGTKADLKAMTTAQAIEVYKRQYWDRVAGDDLPAGIDYTVVDFAVNSGPARAAKYLQAVLGVEQDGKIGPATLKAARAETPRDVIRRVNEDRLAFLQRLKTWPTFGRGWAKRVERVRVGSIMLAEQAKPAPKPIPQVAQEVADEPQPTLLQILWAILFGGKK